MRRIILLMMISGLSVPSSSAGRQGLAVGKRFLIDQLYRQLSNSRRLNARQVKGAFQYYLSDQEHGHYEAEFYPTRGRSSIKYFIPGGTRKDHLSYHGADIRLTDSWDPLSIKMYKIKFNGKRFVFFTGKAVSASGSGVQLTYYCSLELNRCEKVLSHAEFKSRFGDIENVIWYKKHFCYFKIINGKGANEYRLTLNDISDDKPMEKGEIRLTYHLNDVFSIAEDHLSKKLGGYSSFN